MERNSDIMITIGGRLRARRRQNGYSQECVSEKANLHPAYIGQLERGEKNATIISIEKICRALNLPMDELFVNIVSADSPHRPAQECYDLILSLPVRDQRKICEILKMIIRFRYG